MNDIRRATDDKSNHVELKMFGYFIERLFISTLLSMFTNMSELFHTASSVFVLCGADDILSEKLIPVNRLTRDICSEGITFYCLANFTTCVSSFCGKWGNLLCFSLRRAGVTVKPGTLPYPSALAEAL